MTNPTEQAAPSERTAFEQYAAKRGAHLERMTDHSRFYLDPLTQEMWWAWEAALAAKAPQAGKLPPGFDMHEDYTQAPQPSDAEYQERLQGAVDAFLKSQTSLHDGLTQAPPLRDAFEDATRMVEDWRQTQTPQAAPQALEFGNVAMDMPDGKVAMHHGLREAPQAEPKSLLEKMEEATSKPVPYEGLNQRLSMEQFAEAVCAAPAAQKAEPQEPSRYMYTHPIYAPAGKVPYLRWDPLPEGGWTEIPLYAAPLGPIAPPAVARARPLSEYHEDQGFVVWWKFPIDEPAWIGTPTDSDWPGYHTHWTPHPTPPGEPRT